MIYRFDTIILRSCIVCGTVEFTATEPDNVQIDWDSLVFTHFDSDLVAKFKGVVNYSGQVAVAAYGLEEFRKIITDLVEKYAEDKCLYEEYVPRDERG